MHKTKIIILLLLLTLFQTSLFAENDTGLINSNPSQISMFLYTPEFAKNFNLAIDKAQKLDKGLQAIQFLIVKSNSDTNPTYDCKINLYVDSNLAIFYPNDDAGDLNGYLQTINQAQQPLSSNNNENQIILKSPSKYINKIFIASQLMVKQRGINLPDNFYSPAFLAFHRKLFHNISYISFSAQCPTLLNNIHGSTIWIAKNTISTNFSVKTFRFSNKNFYQFNIPTQITDWDYLKKAMQDSNYAILLNETHLYDSF